MNSENSKKMLDKLTIELAEVNQRRKTATSIEESQLYLRANELASKIAEIEWAMKSSEEKQMYRKAVINLGKKWGSMKGTTVENMNLKPTLEYLIEIYELTDKILQQPDLSPNIRQQIQQLREEIDRNPV